MITVLNYIFGLHVASCPSPVPPRPAADNPVHALVFQPRVHAPVGAQARVLGVLGSTLLHVGLLAAAALGSGAALPSGDGQAAVPAVESRVQLRFVSASEPAADAGADTGPPAMPTGGQPRAAASDPTPKAAAPAVTAPRDLAAATAPAGPYIAENPDEAALSAGLASAAAVAMTAPAASHRAIPHGHQRGAHHGQDERTLAATGDAPASAPAVAPGGQAEADWTRAVMRRLERFRSYPAAARHSRAEGVVLVQATIGADGRVLDTRLRTSCGNADLDAAALATVTRAHKLPAPPAHLSVPLQVDLSVAFALRS